MAIYKAVVESAYAQIPNETLQDKTLSFEARGLLAMLLSMPADWEIHKAWVVEQSNAGKDKVNSIFRELLDAGYIRKEDGQRKRGKFSHDDYFVFPSKTTVADLPQRLDRSGQTVDGETAPTKETVIQNKHIQNKHSLDARGALPVIEQTKQVKPKKQKLTANDLVNEFKNHWPLIAQCDDEILHAWCQVRIEKKAEHTELAHKAIEHELSILAYHGLTVTQAIREAAANGWKGLKASWYDVVKYAGNAKPVDNYRTADAAIKRLNDTSWAE